MFGFASQSRVSLLEKELCLYRDKVQRLEDTIHMLSNSINSLQSAMLAGAKTQEAVAYDVARIGELISAMLEATDVGGFSGPEGGNSGSGGETMH